MIIYYKEEKYNYNSFLFFIILLLLFINNSNKTAKFNLSDDQILKQKSVENFDKCYIPLDFSNIKLIHIIITRFLIEFNADAEFKNNLYGEKYIRNGFRVMSKYLITSLENQSCKDFIWILMLGNKANIEYVRSIMKFNCTFNYRIVYLKDLKNYVNKLSYGFDILITTRIDYDDIIYYDAVNDIRKAINLKKPILLHGYNRGIYYFESNNKFYENYRKNETNGALGLFLSLIVVLNKINTTITIYEIGAHTHVRYNLLKKYKHFGLKKLNYEQSVFDSGSYKYIYIRQNYSISYNITKDLMNQMPLKNFNFNQFFGK